MADIEPNNQSPQEPTPGPRKPKVPQMPKFNFYWIYGIIFAIFLGIQLMPHDVALKTTWFRVQSDMIMANGVEKITIVNEKRAEVTLKKEALSGEKFKDLKDRSLFGEDIGPHYYFEIGDVTQFRADLKDAELEYAKRNPGQNIQIPVEYTTQHNYFGDILGWILPFLLLLGLWMFLMRKMGSGGAGGGGGRYDVSSSCSQSFIMCSLLTVVG